VTVICDDLLLSRATASLIKLIRDKVVERTKWYVCSNNAKNIVRAVIKITRLCNILAPNGLGPFSVLPQYALESSLRSFTTGCPSGRQLPLEAFCGGHLKVRTL
jgi:hypothetical protein